MRLIAVLWGAKDLLAIAVLALSALLPPVAHAGWQMFGDAEVFSRPSYRNTRANQCDIWWAQIPQSAGNFQQGVIVEEPPPKRPGNFDGDFARQLWFCKGTYNGCIGCTYSGFQYTYWVWCSAGKTYQFTPTEGCVPNACPAFGDQDGTDAGPQTCPRIVDRDHGKPPRCEDPSGGNPIYPLTGVKRQTEELLLLGSAAGRLRLTYSNQYRLPLSTGSAARPAIASERSFGDLWASSLHKRLILQRDGAGVVRGVQAWRGDSVTLSFVRGSDGAYSADSDIADKLVSLPSGWRVSGKSGAPLPA
jgi:hypothetical protein